MASGLDVQPFVMLLIEPRFTILLALVESLDISDEDKAADEVADVLVSFLKALDRIVPFLKVLITREVTSIDNANTLFRRNSIASKMLTRFTSETGQAFLRSILADTLKRAESMSAVECELNPEKGAGDNPARAAQVLTSLCTQIVQTSCNAGGALFPPELREISHQVKKEVAGRFGDKMGLAAVGGYVFLRYVCPAMLAPERYGLVPDPSALSKDARRVLMQVSKVIQTLANGITTFKEDYMRPMDGFLQNQGPVFASFLDRISGPVPAPRVAKDEQHLQLQLQLPPPQQPSQQAMPPISPRGGPRPMPPSRPGGPVAPPRTAGAATTPTTTKQPSSPHLMAASVDQQTAIREGLLSIQQHLKRNIHKIGSVIAALDSGAEGLGSLKTNAEKAGWLKKRGGRNTGWKKRWFVFKGSQLVYFATPQSGIAGGRIPLGGTRLTVANSTEFTIVAEYRSFEIQAESDAEQKDWIRAIQLAQKGPTVVPALEGLAAHEDDDDVDDDNDVEESPLALLRGGGAGASEGGGAPKSPRTDRGGLRAAAAAAAAASAGPSSTAAAEGERDVRGWLKKANPKGTGWKKRWFILNGNLLIYFKAPNDAAPQGEIKIDDARVRSVDSTHFNIETPARTYFLQASTEREKASWISTLDKARVEFVKQLVAEAQRNDSEIQLAAPSPVKAVDLMTSGHHRANEEEVWAIESQEIVKEGVLSKQGGQIKTWKKRWFVLRGHHLYYYQASSDKVPLGSIPLANSKITPTEKTSFEILTGKRNFFVRANTKADMDSWIEALVTAARAVSTVDKLAAPVDNPAAAASSNNFPVACEGNLQKQGGTMKSWRTRWFVLQGPMLSYFKDPQDPQAAGVIPVANCSVTVAEEKLGKKNAFEITTRYRNYFLIAKDEFDMAKWMRHIQHASASSTNAAKGEEMSAAMKFFFRLNEMLAEFEETSGGGSGTGGGSSGSGAGGGGSK